MSRHTRRALASILAIAMMMAGGMSAGQNADTRHILAGAIGMGLLAAGGILLGAQLFRD